MRKYFVVQMLVLCSFNLAQAQPILQASSFKHYIDTFNANDNELYKQAYDNDHAWNFLKNNIPLFNCPDKVLEATYYFRWWTYKKHIKITSEGTIITEFLPDVYWAGRNNSINCATGHHIYEGRWLHDTTVINSYINFWFTGGGNKRSYSTWLADAILQYTKVTGNTHLAVNLLDSLIANYYAWQKSNGSAKGLFYSIDDRDGMEVSASGSGLRPTLNSYMYADATAIATIAKMANQPNVSGDFYKKARQIKDAVQKYLWNDTAQFFTVIPAPNKDSAVRNFSTYRPSPIRELLGYTPWYVNLADTNYAIAWQQLMQKQGFYAPYGLTTTEQRSPKFAVSYSGHECQWNGPSWPFATSVTLTALANLLQKHQQPYITNNDYRQLLNDYARAHYRTTSEGKMLNWIDENLDPYTGEWLSRTRLEHWKNGTWDAAKGGVERGKDYNHSTFCDLVISGLIGLQPQTNNTLNIHPLVDNSWEYFCLDNVLYHGKIITVMYDKTGQHYGKGKGFRVLVNGEAKILVNEPQPVTLAI